MNGCRIGKVRYKNAPHLVEIIPEIRGARYPEMMHKYVDTIDSHYEKGMAGFVIVGWGFDGKFSRGSCIHIDSFVGVTMLPSFIAEILRRDTTEDVIHGIFNN